MARRTFEDGPGREPSRREPSRPSGRQPSLDTGRTRELAAVMIGMGIGALGALPVAGGSSDPLVLLAWLALVAPAVGYGVGAWGLGAWPFACAIPAAGMPLVVATAAASERLIPSLVWPGLVLGGLYALGYGLGRAAGARGPGQWPGPWPWPGAGGLLLCGLLLSGLCVQLGLPEGDAASWGRTHPGLVGRLLDLSPVGLVYDAAGWDWVHAHPRVYRVSGVEWVQRVPTRGRVAGPALLVVGCAAAVGLSRRRRNRRGRDAPL